MKKTILISGASGIVGYGILRSLLKCKGGNTLIASSIYNDSIACVFSDIFELAEPTNSDKYIYWLFSIIKKHNVDMIIPGIEDDMYLWNSYRNEIEKLGVIVLLNNSELIELCKDKWEFYKYLIEVIPQYLIPTSDKVHSNIYAFPYIFKPKRGYGSKGIVIINNEEDYQRNKEKINSDFIVQPIVGSDDEEYTVSAFFDNKSTLIEYLSLKRKLSKHGYTEVAQIVDYDFNEILCRIADVIKPIGPTNFQFRLDGEVMKLIEINPRISSSTSIRASFGYNESQMSVDYFISNITPNKIDKSALKNLKAIRYIEEYIFDDSSDK